MKMPDGAELDRLVSRLLNGADNKGHPYSKSEIAEKRLVFRLTQDLGFEVQVFEADAAWYCRLSRSGEIVATGSGSTRPCAVARAAANLHPSLLGSAPRASTTKRAVSVRGEILPAVDCEGCGNPMLRPTSTGTKICPPCAYRRIRSIKPRRRSASAAGRKGAVA